MQETCESEPMWALVGATASGKSALALELCERLDAELLSLDSMQVYLGMDIGTAKPTPEERARVPHHLIDLVSPAERYDVQRFLTDARAAEAEVRARGKRALFVGGTGFYLRALTHGVFEGPPVDQELRRSLEERAERDGDGALHAELASVDPESAERIHANDRRRVVRGLELWHQTGRTLTSWQDTWRQTPGRARRILGLRTERETLTRRIQERARTMLTSGWPEEARAVRDGPGYGPTAIQALGYRDALALADGELSLDEAAETISLATRQFARRQDTWYRKFQEIHWLDANPGSPDAQHQLDRAATHLSP